MSIAHGIDPALRTAGDHARLQRLQQEGCDLGQGFLLARPLDGHDVERLLDAAIAA